jgi:replicative DNA helicase
MSRQDKCNAACDLHGMFDISIYENTLMTIDKIELICKVACQQKKIGVIVVDYLGLVQSHGKKEHYLAQAEIAQRLAALAIELNLVIIALSQTNRDHKSRKPGDKCPYPTDAADSSGSERSSSLWFGIDRPEIDDDSIEFKNMFQLKCRKNRNGEIFEGEFDFNEGRFVERTDFGRTEVTGKPLADVYGKLKPRA